MSVPAAACQRCGGSVGAVGVCPRCLLEAELPPAKLGDALELGEEIGHGGMGSVFKARHLRLDRTVAVKLLAPELATDASMRERFLREGHALAKLTHPNIVQIYDCGETDGQPYLAMEFIDGKPLASCLPMPATDAVRVASEVASALELAHSKGVIHRDIKPANILMDTAGHAHLTDFGIARLLAPEDAGWTVTRADQLLGTPHYLPPEVLQGSPADARADIYALGVVLYQMLTGELPAGGLRPVPPALEPVVHRALAADPNHRFASAAELRRALEQISFDGPDALPPDEAMWQRGAALLCTAAAGLSLWAFTLSLTPHVRAASEVSPLTELAGAQLSDGRYISYARFEVVPTLIALVVLAVSFAALGVLRRHWRLAGLDAPRPELPLTDSTIVFGLGVACEALHGLRFALDHFGLQMITRYTPIPGGILELVVFFFFFGGMLQAWRTRRALTLEPMLFFGLVLALIPPTHVFLSFLTSWKP